MLETNSENRCIICKSENVEKFRAEILPFLLDRMFNNKQLGENFLYHCKDCEMYWSSFRPNDEEICKYYKNYMKDEYIQARDAYEPGFANWRNDYDIQNGFEKELFVRKSLMKNLFEKYVDYKKIENILDYGGARGEFIIDEFKNADKFVYDVDTTQPIKDDIKKISHDEMFDKKFDFIQCRHTLEHVSYPINIIEEIKSLLKVDGYLYIEVPFEDYPKIYIKDNKEIPIHEHINLFRKEVFEKIFNNPNFAILELNVLEQKALFGQTKIIVCLVKQISCSNEAILLNKLYSNQSNLDSVKNIILELKNENIELLSRMNNLSVENRNLNSKIDNLSEVNNVLNSKIDYLISRANRPTILQQIFSVRNEGAHKVWRIFGIKIKCRRKIK